jgi:ABC-type Zn2+ transport system substrate-binding protein/surface adhesin
MSNLRPASMIGMLVVAVLCCAVAAFGMPKDPSGGSQAAAHHSHGHDHHHGHDEASDHDADHAIPDHTHDVPTTAVIVSFAAVKSPVSRIEDRTPRLTINARAPSDRPPRFLGAFA